MSRLIFSLLCCIVINSLHAQSHTNLLEVTPGEEFENIKVQQLDTDPMASTFLIWVNHSVKQHYHAEHTEIVQVLEGNGTMTLGAESFPINAGDYIFIPKGTYHSVEVSGDVPLKALSIQTPEFDGSDRIFVNEE